MSRTRIAVVGPGAIGTTIAAALHEAGNTPMLCGRTPAPHVRLIADDTTITVPGPVRTDPSTTSDPVDVVLLAVKATQLAAASDWLHALVRPGTVVCVLQNGIEQAETVGPMAPQAEVLPAIVWFPATREGDGDTRLLGTPRITLPDTAAAAVVLDALAGGRCAVDVATDFREQAWRKLLQNAAAGLMAITGRRVEVFTRDDIGALARDYLRECTGVARADGVALADDLPEEIVSGLRAMPAGRGTSILEDREAGRPLEWDVRNAVVRRAARRLGIATPISDVLVPLLAATSDGPG